LQAAGQGAFQVEGVSVRVEVQRLQRRLHGSQGGGGGAEGIFIGGELDDVVGRAAQLAGDLLDGPAGLIDGEVFEGRVEGKAAHSDSNRFQDLIHIDVLGDEVADDGDLFRVGGLRLDGQIVDLGGHLVAVLAGEEDGEGHAANDLHDIFAGPQLAGEDDAGEHRAAFGAGAGGEDDVLPIARGDEQHARL